MNLANWDNREECVSDSSLEPGGWGGGGWSVLGL